MNDGVFPNTLEIVRRPLAGGAETVLQGFPLGHIQALSANATTVLAQIAVEQSEPAPKTITTIWSFGASAAGARVEVASFEVQSLISEQPMFMSETDVYWSVRRKNLDTSDTYRAPLAGGAPAALFEKDADLLGLTKTHIVLGFRTEHYLRNVLRIRPIACGPLSDLLKDEEIGTVVTDETHACGRLFRPSPTS